MWYFQGGPRQLPHSPRPISTTARVGTTENSVNFSLKCQTKSLFYHSFSITSLVTFEQIPRYGQYLSGQKFES